MDYCVFHVYFIYIQYKYFVFICIYASHKCTIYVAYICVCTYIHLVTGLLEQDYGAVLSFPVAHEETEE